ncbi:hypothetical protein TEA_026053 [Camellia sinensis var. sinensis]|uniref:Uncharacterized protein n=1 Tax=Camellia sinensis var. sinensis TaxID=542762 RepID=A0A4S4EKA6_CAMSN|nr:hypothetical protein TEA_026053 [Camellia sinensis var. sinensis]
MDLGIERPDIGGAENGAKSTLCSSSSSGHVASTTKQTKLVQDENQLLENILRTLLQELVSAAVQSGEKIMEYGQLIVDGEVTQGQIPRLLELKSKQQTSRQQIETSAQVDTQKVPKPKLICPEHVEAGMIFQLLEDLTEMSTMRNCKDIFGYIESKQDILGKANDVVFCGRIIMFLAHFFPLSERSAVNIKGVFNTSNETKYEKEAPEGISIDFNFYKTFWSLQVVLNTFDAQPLSDEEGNANNLEDEAATFGIKYLTSSKLMGLEVQRCLDELLLLQNCLLANLMALYGAIASGVAIPRPRSLPFGVTLRLQNPNPKNKEVVLIPTYTASVQEKNQRKKANKQARIQDFPFSSHLKEFEQANANSKEEIKSFEERVKKLLEMTPPNGKEFLNSIDHILERERNWVWWKRDGCPPFEKPLIEKKSVQDGAKKRKIRWRLGNKELSQLWKWADQNPGALVKLKGGGTIEKRSPARKA